MAKSAKSTIPQSTNRKLYADMVAGIPDVELKGKSMQYTALNGNMFSFVDKEDKVGIRLPEDKRNEFLEKYDTVLFEAHGTVLKEYVTVPDDVLNNKKLLNKYFKVSYEYAKTLKPKANKKK